MLEEIRNINPTRSDLKKFAITVGIAFFIIVTFFYYKQYLDTLWLLTVPVFLIILGVTVPEILKPAYWFWMTLAFLIQWFMTHFILTILFYLVVTPIGLIHRLFNKDFLSLQFKRNSKSYWQERKHPVGSLKDYGRQF